MLGGGSCPPSHPLRFSCSTTSLPLHPAHLQRQLQRARSSIFRRSSGRALRPGKYAHTVHLLPMHYPLPRESRCVPVRPCLEARRAGLHLLRLPRQVLHSLSFFVTRAQCDNFVTKGFQLPHLLRLRGQYLSGHRLNPRYSLQLQAKFRAR